MVIKELKIKGVFEVVLDPHNDERGFFMRTYDQQIFSASGIDREWVQENHSRTEKKGIIRGLHFQLPPYAETKLIRCIRGSVYDVFVDLRKDSVTFGRWDSLELSEENKKMVFIPKGFAHGFCTLTEVSEVIYKVDSYYKPDTEEGIIWSDKTLKINWPLDKPVLSVKDASLGSLEDFIKKHASIEI